ncbi:MAG: protein kinase [Myxococcota bacterium]|nr:protein kinase [Myxococcota bacterium]
MTYPVGTILDGKYELGRLIGEGGMGTVYEATHRLIRRRLAVKFLHSQFVTSQEVVTRFQREAQAAAAIGHENIIEVTDMGSAPDGAPYIVMEYLEGNDLKQLIAKEGVLPPARAAHIAGQALFALQAAHQVGIIHRDIKPENIYLIDKPNRTDYVKLLDFGISKFRSLEAEGMKGLTQTGTVLGTPYYMSPEQARGDQNLSARSDIYAMGVILYQMLTGRLPFDAPNYNALLIKILTEDPDPPEAVNPDIPADLAATIKVSMARDPSARFDDCLAFRNQLASHIPGESAIQLDTGLSPASRTAVRAALATGTETPLEMTRTGLLAPKRKWGLIAGGFLGLAVVASVIFMLVRPSDAPSPNAAAAPSSTGSALEVANDDEKATGNQPHSADVAADADKEEIRVKIAANPKTATIKIDGQPLAGNPFEGIFVKDGQRHKVEIAAAGYKTEIADISFKTDQTLSYSLMKIEASTTTGETRSKSTSRSSRRRKKKSKRDVTPEKPPSGSVDLPPEKKPRKKPKRKIDDEDPWS